eukprot:jgi/Mesen1/9435/ME000618S08827
MTAEFAVNINEELRDEFASAAAEHLAMADAGVTAGVTGPQLLVGIARPSVVSYLEKDSRFRNSPADGPGAAPPAFKAPAASQADVLIGQDVQGLTKQSIGNDESLEGLYLSGGDSDSPSAGELGLNLAEQTHGRTSNRSRARAANIVPFMIPIPRKGIGSGFPYAPVGWSWRIQTDVHTATGFWSDVAYKHDMTGKVFYRRKPLVEYLKKQFGMSEERTWRYVNCSFPRIPADLTREESTDVNPKAGKKRPLKDVLALRRDGEASPSFLPPSSNDPACPGARLGALAAEGLIEPEQRAAKRVSRRNKGDLAEHDSQDIQLSQTLQSLPALIHAQERELALRERRKYEAVAERLRGWLKDRKEWDLMEGGGLMNMEFFEFLCALQIAKSPALDSHQSLLLAHKLRRRELEEEKKEVLQLFVLLMGLCPANLRLLSKSQLLDAIFSSDAWREKSRTPARIVPHLAHIRGSGQATTVEVDVGAARGGRASTPAVAAGEEEGEKSKGCTRSRDEMEASDSGSVENFHQDVVRGGQNGGQESGQEGGGKEDIQRGSSGVTPGKPEGTVSEGPSGEPEAPLDLPELEAADGEGGVDALEFLHRLSHGALERLDRDAHEKARQAEQDEEEAGGARAAAEALESTARELRAALEQAEAAAQAARNAAESATAKADASTGISSKVSAALEDRKEAIVKKVDECRGSLVRHLALCKEVDAMPAIPRDSTGIKKKAELLAAIAESFQDYERLLCEAKSRASEADSGQLHFGSV